MFKIRTKLLLGVLIFVALAGSLSFFLKQKQKPAAAFILAKKGEIVQEVSVTGKVKPAESLDLAFDAGGTVSQIYFGVGERVQVRQVIARLDSSQLQAELERSKANLAAETARLEELRKGTRPEELAVARTALANAQKSFGDAQANLESVQNKANIDLASVYDSALSEAQKAVGIAKTSLMTLTDLQYSHFPLDNNLADAKAAAVLLLLGQSDAGRWTTQGLNNLSGGAFGDVQKAVANPVQANTDSALFETGNALQKTKDCLDAVPINDLTSTEKTNLTAEKTNIAVEISSFTTKYQAVLIQKATNENNLAAAKTALTTAQNSFNNAQDNLSLKEAGATSGQISVQMSLVEAARAGVESIRAQINKTIVNAPIDGILTKKEIEKGESVLPNAPVFSLMSLANFEIEASIPEADIAKLQINQAARVTLDAFGQDKIFGAQVIEIDPAETIIEGVATYKVKLQFLSGQELIKSGMTANIDILIAKVENAILIPQRAVISRNGGRFVKVLGKNNISKEIEVKTGLRGSGGNIEILEGLNEGDRVVISTE